MTVKIKFCIILFIYISVSMMILAHFGTSSIVCQFTGLNETAPATNLFTHIMIFFLPIFSLVVCFEEYPTYVSPHGVLETKTGFWMKFNTKVKAVRRRVGVLEFLASLYHIKKGHITIQIQIKPRMFWFVIVCLI